MVFLSKLNGKKLYWDLFIFLFVRVILGCLELLSACVLEVFLEEKKLKIEFFVLKYLDLNFSFTKKFR
jgi:hypothetical protein